MTQSIPLTFGELKVGDRFIGFPLDGDDSGHGGFRNGSYLFEKISDGDRVSKMELVDNARRLVDGVVVHDPRAMKVLKIL